MSVNQPISENGIKPNRLPYDSESRFDAQFFFLRWSDIKHQAFIKFILKFNIIFIVSYINDRKLLSSNIDDSFEIPFPILELLCQEYPRYTPYFSSEIFRKDFWLIVRDLSISSYLNGNGRTRYFVVNSLDEIDKLENTGEFNGKCLALLVNRTDYRYKRFNPKIQKYHSYVYTDKGTISEPTDKEYELINQIANTKSYTNFIRFFEELPDDIKISLCILFENGIYPKFFTQYPYMLERIINRKGEYAVRMNSEKKNAMLMVEVNEKIFLNKLRKSVGRLIVES